jgi:integrase
MPGCRALTPEEVLKVTENLPDAQVQCLFVLGIRTGLRVQELLNIRFEDVLEGRLWVKRLRNAQNPRSKVRDGRFIALHREALDALRGYLVRLSGGLPTTPIFSMDYYQVRRALQRAFDRAGLDGKLSTHTMRKTFAMSMYKKLGKDIVALQKAMGHAHVDSTAHYISVDMDAVNKAILED